MLGVGSLLIEEKVGRQGKSRQRRKGGSGKKEVNKN